MTKHTAIIFLGVFVVALAIAGFPSWVSTSLLIISGVVISILAYLSSVVYCSNCKKLIDDASQILDDQDSNTEVTS